MKTWEGRMAFRLKQAALAKNLDSKQIAEILSRKFHCKTGPRTVDSWMCGVRIPELRRLRALAKLLEVDMNELLE